MRPRFLALRLLCAGAVYLTFCPAPCAAAPTIWSGFAVSFSKASNTNYQLPEFQDRITDNVWLTRGPTAGLFNIHEEEFYQPGSPEGTRWATAINNPGKTIAATNWSDLAFDNWIDAYGGGGGGQLPPLLLGNNAVVHLVDDDIYLDLQFTSWTTSGGGGFAYIRSAAVPEPSLLMLAVIAFATLFACRMGR
jgi:hypothetical protein